MDQLAKASCAAARSCCKTFSGPVALDDCETAFRTRSMNYAAAKRGTERIDAAVLTRCLSAYTAAASKCARSPVEVECYDLWAGTLPVGASCNGDDRECQPVDGFAGCLVTEQNSHQGVCVRAKRGVLGEGCQAGCDSRGTCIFTIFGKPPAGQEAFCFEADGLYCGSLGDKSVCQQFAARGTSCESSSELTVQCASADTCSYDSINVSAPPKCKPVNGPGQSCDPGCQRDLTCVDDKCSELPFANEYTCKGDSLSP